MRRLLLKGKIISNKKKEPEEVKPVIKKPTRRMNPLLLRNNIRRTKKKVVKNNSVFNDSKNTNTKKLSKTNNQTQMINNYNLNYAINFNLPNFYIENKNFSSYSGFIVNKDEIKSIDGIEITNFVLGMTFLVWKQINKNQNGIYILDSIDDNSSLLFKRINSFNSKKNIINGSLIFVNDGCTYGGTVFIYNSDCKNFIIDQSDINFKPLTTSINSEKSDIDVSLEDGSFILSIPDNINKNNNFQINNSENISIKSEKKIEIGNENSNLIIENNVVYIEDLEVSGDVTIGDSSSSRLIINAEIDSHLVPSDNNRNIGSEDKKWNTIYAKMLEGQVSDISNHSATELFDINDVGSGRIITNEERQKLEKLDELTRDKIELFHIKGLNSIGSGSIISSQERESINNSNPSSLPNTIVRRDRNNNFSANQIKSNLIGNVTGQVSDISNHIENIDSLNSIINSGSGKIISEEERELLKKLNDQVRELRRKLGLENKRKDELP